MKKHFILLCAALSIAATCDNKLEPEPPQPQTLSVSPASLSFSADGTQTETVSVTTDGTWTASASSSWIQFKPSSGSGNGTVTVTAAYNASGDRSGKLTFKSGSLSKEVTVSQSGAQAAVETEVVPQAAAFDGKKRSSTTYQLLIYTFADSDGDGVGDFNGIKGKLDYLDAMGVTALWLSPAHPADSYHGYGVTDYNGVHPKFGTEADFKALVDAAHAKGIKIYMDYVLNHSGKGHPWFKEALADASSPYRDYYFISGNPSQDYKKFPMLDGTSYVEKEWIKAAVGSPKITITKTDEAVTSGTASWNIWFWKQGQNGKEIKFNKNSDGSYYLVLEVSGASGILLRGDSGWDYKYGAPAGNTTLTEGVTMELVPEGADISFTGSGKYRIDLTNVPQQTSTWYMSAFGSGWMPDLNYGAVSSAENSACFKAIAASADKWIKMGVDGFRLDAVKHICGGIDSYNNSANIVLLDKWYSHCNATYKAAGHSDNIFMVAEAWLGHATEKLYYKGLTSCFEFDYAGIISDALNNGVGNKVPGKIIGFVTDHSAQRSDAITSFFFSNHDQDRWAEWIGKDIAREKQAAAILLTGPGKPFIYQGEELGYYGTKSNGDEGVRQPMAWDSSLSGLAKYGLSDDWKTDKTDHNMVKGSISVASQEADENSLLNVYKSWSKLRNTYPALAAGEMSAHGSLNGDNSGAASIAAWYMTSGSQKLLVIHNVGNITKSVTIQDDMSKPIALLGTASTTGKSLKLGPRSSVVFEL